MPNEDSVVLRFLALPTDADATGGTVQAGSVLEWIDRAGFATAVAWSGTYCVTAYVGNVHFAHPICPGDMVEAQGRIIQTGKTSMNVLVTISAGDPRHPSKVVSAHCVLVFVALDERRMPQPVPSWRPATVRDLELEMAARERIEARLVIRQEMERAYYPDQTSGSRVVLRFLASPLDANWGGKVHGGTVMRWIDTAAATCVAQWARERGVSVYSGGIHFERAIAVGDLVEVDARLIMTTARSLHVSVQVRSTAVTEMRFTRTTTCMGVFVVTTNGRAGAVRPFQPQTEEEERLEAMARRLQRLRDELPQLII